MYVICQVDFQHEEHFTVGVRPDVLVLPSDLTRFAETLVGNVACVNPGRCHRDRIGVCVCVYVSMCVCEHVCVHCMFHLHEVVK